MSGMIWLLVFLPMKFCYDICTAIIPVNLLLRFRVSGLPPVFILFLQKRFNVLFVILGG